MTTTDSPLDRVASTKSAVDRAVGAHHQAIRDALADGVPLRQVTKASMYESRTTIYDIRDGKK